MKLITSTDRRVLLSALIVSAGFAAAKFAGVVDDFVVARVFGAGRELDAYYAAFGLPDLLFTLIAGGALASAFIPVFTSYLTAGDREGAWKLASSVVNVAFLVTLAAAALAALIAPWLVRRFLAPGFVPEQQALTASLMRLVLISTAIFSVSGLVMSALQANQHFLLPALAPVMYNLGIIGGAVFLTQPATLTFWKISIPIRPVLSLGVHGLVVGVVVGAVMHLLIQVPGLIRFGARWSPSFSLADPSLRHVLVLLGPRILGLGVVQLTALITTNLASRLSAGSVTSLAFAWRLMQMPETIIATAIGTAVFPTLSALAAQHRRVELHATMRKALGAIVLLSVPAAAILIVWRRPLSGLFFGPSNADVVAYALQFYALGLVGHSALEVAARTFYAQQDTRTPLAVAAGAMVITVSACLILMRPLSYGGLALGNAIGFTVESGVLVWLMERRLMDIIIRKFHVDDTPALVPLHVAVEETDHLGLVTTEDDIRKVYAMPALQPAENLFVAQAPDGQIVGVTWLMVNQGEGETVFALNGHVHPAWRRQGIGRQLLDATIARARERLGEAAGRRAWLQSEYVHDTPANAGRVALFERSGFQVARWAVDMRRELPGVGRIAPLIPIVRPVSGVQLRKWRAGVDDEAVGWMLDEAFRDHWGYTTIHIDDWLEHVRNGFVSTEHSVLAWDVASGQIVGACVNACDERTFKRRGRRELYVTDLAVCREHRRRGVAKALLTWTLHRADHLGMQSVGLDADAENLTGAVQLYAGLGFEIFAKLKTYRKEFVD
jgi:putative peptidoglycan lipid II flippase